MTTTIDWTPHVQALTADLRKKGALHTDTVATAIESVPRHLFLTGHYAAGHHTSVDPTQPTAELLVLAYADRGIMTHTPSDDAGGFSSASQPSIVAKMLEAAQLRPGMRVLEIGAGTGWNAALISHITATDVHTVEASPLVATEARTGLTRAGIDRVTVHTTDGYAGHPDTAPYDLIIATCGIAGIPPTWLDQLTSGGSILAPVAHGGLHPLLRVTRTDSVTGQLVTNADFMTATGPLYAGATPSPATLGHHLPAPEVTAARPDAVPDDIDPRGAYVDLWMYLAAHDPRITCAGTNGTTEYTGCALVDGDDAVFIQPTGLHPTHGPHAQVLADQAQHYVTQWANAGRPALTAWTCSLAPVGNADDTLLAPTAWRLPAAG